MFGKKKNPDESALARQAEAEKETVAPLAVIADVEQIEKNIYKIPGAVYFGKYMHIDTKNAKNEDQVRAFWEQCRGDGTLETLRSIAHPDAKAFTAICTNFETRAYDYWIAAEVMQEAEIPEGFEKFDVEERQCAVFRCEGPAHEAITQKWHFIYNKWFPKGKYGHDKGPEIENYPFGDMQAQDYQCEILVPVKPQEPIALPRRGDTMTGLIFVAIGAVGGMVLAGNSDKYLIFALVGGVAGYFVYSYVNNRREEIRKRKEEQKKNGEEKK